MAASRLFVLSSLVVAQLVALVRGSCSTFDPVLDYHNYPSGQTYTSITTSVRLSAAVYCENPPSADQSLNNTCGPEQCYLSAPANFLYNVNSILNISVPLEQEKSILSLVKNSLSETAGSNRYNFNITQTYSTGWLIQYCIPRNQTEWIAITPYTICSTGHLGDCSGDGAPADGTVITACGIVTLLSGTDYGYPVADGSIHTVTTDASGAGPAPANETDIATNRGTSGAPSCLAMDSVWGWIVIATAIIWSICL